MTIRKNPPQGAVAAGDVSRSSGEAIKAEAAGGKSAAEGAVTEEAISGHASASEAIAEGSPTEAAATPPIKLFIRLKAGEGGIFNLSHNNLAPDSITAVGTAGCRTCVGVFFMLDDERCFAAHISASSSLPMEEDDFDVMYRMPTKLSPRLEHVFMDRLANTLGAGWQVTDAARHSLVMVCPVPRDPDPPTSKTEPLFVGHHILRWIAAFFDVKVEERVDPQFHGFIVEAPGVVPLMMGRSKEWEGDRQPEDVGYEGVGLDPKTVDVWRFGLHPVWETWE